MDLSRSLDEIFARDLRKGTFCGGEGVDLLNVGYSAGPCEPDASQLK